MCFGAIALLVVVAAFGLIAIYNRLVVLRNRVDNSWSQIDVQLRRRYDLIPNLVETVKGYASHESQTFERVTQARTMAINAQTVKEQGEAENMLTGALKSLFAVAEAYPELKANQNFLLPAGGALQHRGQDRLRAAVLQRLGHELQHGHPVVPDESHRRDVRFRAARILRDRGRGCGAREGGLLVARSSRGPGAAAAGAVDAVMLASIAFPNIDPVLVRIGPLSVHWYGIAYIVAFVSAGLIARHLIRAMESTAV